VTTQLLDADQVAAVLLVSPKTVIRMAQAGELPVVRIGRYYRFRPEALDAWLEQRETAGTVGCVTPPTTGTTRRQPGRSRAH
jgi:excisionase family DNA binding protein